jgi:hypothetical protein
MIVEMRMEHCCCLREREIVHGTLDFYEGEVRIEKREKNDFLTFDGRQYHHSYTRQGKAVHSHQ